MEIGFIDQEQEELCANQRRLKKKIGGQEAIVKSMSKHMANLTAAEVLADMYKFGGKLEELTQEKDDRVDQFSLRHDRQYRLIFKPATSPIPKNSEGEIDWEQVNIPRKPDGGIDLTKVTAVIIIEAVSKHYQR